MLNNCYYLYLHLSGKPPHSGANGTQVSANRGHHISAIKKSRYALRPIVADYRDREQRDSGKNFCQTYNRKEML